MSELRLDYFLSLGLKLVNFDECRASNQKLTVSGSCAAGHKSPSEMNEPNDCDSTIFITSLTPRKNTGEQPCGDGVPVVTYWRDMEDIERHLADSVDWVNGMIKQWKPDLQKLIEMQAESDNKMKKLNSSDIEWLDDDVVAVINVESNELRLKFSFEPEDCLMIGQEPGFNFKSHKFSKDCYYLVYQETNKTVESDAVESHEEFDSGMRKAMQDIAVSCGKKFAVNIGYDALPKLVDELINGKNDEWVNGDECVFGNDVNCKFIGYLPSAPMCVIETGSMEISVEMIDAISKPDTRTPAEKQVESVASELRGLARTCGFDDAALHLQKIGLLAEIK